MKRRHPAQNSKPSGSGPALFLSLPVPTIVPARETGNIPLGIASLALFAKRARTKKIPALFLQDAANRFGDKAIIDALLRQHPSIIGFSCSVWNIERSLFIAGQIKKSAPNIQIWLGGPEIAPDSPFVADPSSPFDVAVPGEGEIIVEHLLRGTSPNAINGLLLPGGTRTNGAIRPAILDDLSSIHDPFIEGLVKTEADRVLYAELRRGCRYGCSFCQYHQGRKGMFAERSSSQIAEIFRYARRKRISEIYVLDPSFEQHKDFSDFLHMLSRENRNPVTPLFVELRAEAISKPLAALLYKAGVRKVETGLQSVSAAALAKAGRKLHLENFINGIDALRRHGIAVKTDIMVGLPNDSRAGFRQTVEFVRQHGLDEDLQVFHTQVLPGTTLRRQAARQGISFQQRPPYHITGAPGWSATDMSAAIEFAQDRLGISLAPEMRPVLCDDKAAKHPCIRTKGAQFQFRFDLDKAEGIAALRLDTFDGAAAHVTLWICAQDPNAFRFQIRWAIDRLTTNNPFSSISIVLECAPNVALDIADAIDAALNNNLLSTYLENLHSPCAGKRPQRRLFFLVRAQEAGISSDWLLAVRHIAQVIWVSTPLHVESVFRKRRFNRHRDYTFLTLNSGNYDNPKELFSRLIRTSFPSRILLPGPNPHHDWIEFLEKNQGQPQKNMA